MPNRWMDNLRCYVLFNSILITSGRWVRDNERMWALEPRFYLQRFSPPASIKVRTARPVDQRLTYGATGTPHAPDTRCNSYSTVCPPEREENP